MADSVRSLIECGTKLWIDSIDPELIASHGALGATGDTSNPVIVADLIKTGRFDARVVFLRHVRQGAGQQCTAQAVADCFDVFFARGFVNHIECGQRALEHIVLERLAGQLCIGDYPRDDKHGVPFGNAPFDRR